MASTSLLSEFPPVRTADWERAIRAAAAGSNAGEKLRWHPEEGLEVKPYYRAEDLDDLTFLKASPGAFPYVRGRRSTGGWRIREEVFARTAEEANRIAVDAVAAGAEEIAFHGVSIASQAELALLLGDLKQVPVRFCGSDPLSARTVGEWLGIHPHGAEISAEMDPLADPSFSAELCGIAPGLRLFTISADDHEERGAGAIAQIAFALSAGVESIDALAERGVSVGRAAKALGFSFAIGPHFLVEIAKLRAFRLTWARAVESFGGDAESARSMVYVRTAHWNETVYDPHVNVLRATTEAMSAVLGGADSISVTPFDACYREPDEASRRLARNVQLILKCEAEFARVADPLGGAYAVEALTNKIATEAWKIFQDVEAAGGYRKAKVDGSFQSIMERNFVDREASVNSRRLVLTGTNRFANANEKLSGPVVGRRVKAREGAARDFEEIRFRTERAAANGDLPEILIAEFGDAKMSGARAQFANDFLACAGLRGKALHVRSPLEVAESNAGLIVLCSSDSEYPPFADSLTKMLAERASRAQLAIAGKPSCLNELKKSDVAEFIHLGCNAVEVLERIQHKLGIEG
jgi:methylmalonyl-CoA mutase